MSELKKEFTHKLIVPFEYIEKGNNVMAETITMKAPSNSVWQYVICLDEAHSKAQRGNIELFGGIEKIQKLQESQKNVDVKEEKESDESMALAIVSNIMAVGESAKCFEALSKILASGNLENPNATLNNSEKMNKDLFNKLSHNDTKIILGKYILYFLEYSPAQ